MSESAPRRNNITLRFYIIEPTGLPPETLFHVDDTGVVVWRNRCKQYLPSNARVLESPDECVRSSNESLPMKNRNVDLGTGDNSGDLRVGDNFVEIDQPKHLFNIYTYIYILFVSRKYI